MKRHATGLSLPLFFLILWTSGLAFSGLGCVRQRSVDEPLPREDWQISVQEPEEPAAPESPPSSAVGSLPPLIPETPPLEPARSEDESDETAEAPEREKRLPDEKIYMDMKNVDLTILLRTLARIADQSIMISENVRGSATLNVKNQQWDRVFLSLLRTYGLSYEWEGDIIRILTLEDINNEFRRLDVHQRREAKKREIEAVAPFVSEVVKIDFTDAQNLREVLNQLLAGEGRRERRGSVMVDEHTNSLVIQATRNEIDMLKTLVKELDRPTAQVRIEARIVEANGDTARELGVEWGGLRLQLNDDRRYWLTPGANTDTDQDAEDLFPDESEGGRNLVLPSPGLIQSLPGIVSEGAGLNIGFISQKIGRHILALQLSAFQREGKLNILSSPSISTLDNQTAVIESGREVPYQTVEDEEVNIEFKKAVLRLEVTPNVIEGGLLRLNIVTNKDELDFSNTVFGNPIVITKKAQTVVLLRDGQTTVIGGLRKETNSETEIGVPVLKNIPLIGHLFKRNSETNNMEEILIFITPHIHADPL
jgi:type IV pilus assembly protein PilQ